jgi:hypothetical protein
MNHKPHPASASSSLKPRAPARAGAPSPSAQQFEDWLRIEIDKLEAARLNIDPAGLTPETATEVRWRAHDLKALGTTCRFPIVTRLARSLQRLVVDPKSAASVPVFLVDAHVRAIQAAMTQGVRDASDPAGAELVAELERLVAEHRSALAAATKR